MMMFYKLLLVVNVYYAFISHSKHTHLHKVFHHKLTRIRVGHVKIQVCPRESEFLLVNEGLLYLVLCLRALCYNVQ